MKPVILILALLLAGCSVPTSEPNRVTVRQMESQLQLASARLPGAPQRAGEFLAQLRQHSDHLTLRLSFGPGARPLAQTLKQAAIDAGLSPRSVTLVPLFAGGADALTIDADYLLIEGQQCGVISLKSGQHYRFGCSLEHNRVNSLVNPLPRRLRP
ncbi:hypothetical protein SAMN04488540_103130 [Ferrimonas sediminum]|uniref:Lipoprotein n=1 Tax=Ferrimonas sediminum TaxID=718193 RepID=A0A1G8NJH1_9GAMM|nr:hypothetical protein [Ferrimonas sediminum]SDI79660.1 hypothetical protein SAMN04488540_103130 [Ferrimonas sediminum]